VTQIHAEAERRELGHDDIARRAYELWQARGAVHGHDFEDWQRAEAELRRSR
jgi:hypothetical protein